MATVSKSRRKAIPGKTKNGKIRLSSLMTHELQSLLEKSQRPRDKDKIQRMLNLRIKHGK